MCPLAIVRGGGDGGGDGASGGDGGSNNGGGGSNILTLFLPHLTYPDPLNPHPHYHPSSSIPPQSSPLNRRAAVAMGLRANAANMGELRRHSHPKKLRSLSTYLRF